MSRWTWEEALEAVNPAVEEEVLADYPAVEEVLGMVEEFREEPNMPYLRRLTWRRD